MNLNVVRRTVTLCGLIALAGFTSASYALIPAALPNVQDVAATEPLAIDGDWVISVNGKRIRIERGRAYALDSWQHALIWTVQPQMVVIQNIQATQPGVFEGDDLPLLGRARLTALDSGELDVVVATGLGEVKYRLFPIADSAPRDYGEDELPEHELPEHEYAKDEVLEDANADIELPDYAGAENVHRPDAEPQPEDPGANDTYHEPWDGDDTRHGDDTWAEAEGVPETREMPQSRGITPKFVSSDVFTGCQPDETSGPAGQSPRERIDSRVDRITQRQFAGFSLDEARSSTHDDKKLAACWMRLDGVWQENRSVNLDRSKDQPDIWGTDSPELIVLANGNYTDLRHLFIGSVGRDDTEIWLSDGLSANGFVHFVSDDGLSLAQTLVERGPLKVYRANGKSHLGRKLTLDLTASKRARLRLDKVTYLRPKLQMSEAAMQEQTAANDAFLLQANLENLIASRRGYDVVKQDPFFLLDNKKMPVFANFDPKRYYIAEQHTIPVGYKFIQNGVQGMVYNKSMTTTAREYQNSIAVTLGATLEGKTDPAGFGGNASVSVDTSASWLERMEESKHVAQALGYSRAKKYALVVDHPFVSLSDDFIDAIGDALRFGNYDNIIRQFGTHYPYAVTYGAAAKITQSMTEESYQKLTEWNAGVSADVAGGALGQGGSVRGSINGGSVSGSSGTMGSEDTTFVAVGGNGSWNENGYSLGPTPYPILLDLRPLYVLLNHMNFPDQPQVYTRVRAGLKDALETYMRQHANTVSDRSLLPVLVPKKLETWHVYVPEVWCTGKGVLFVADATGTLEMEAYMGNRSRGYKSTPQKHFTTKCKQKKQVVKHKYGARSPGLIELTGTREQIAAYALQLRLKWRYTPSNRNKWRNHKKSYVGLSALKNGLAPGKSKDVLWKVGAKSKPDFTFRVRAKRIR